MIITPIPMNWNCFSGPAYGFPPLMLFLSESEEIITSPHPLRIIGIMTSREINAAKISIAQRSCRNARP